MNHFPLKIKIIIWGSAISVSYPFFNLALHPKKTINYKNKNKTIIVTGATGNLGSAITYDLATRDLRVVMACGDLEKCRMLRRELVVLTGNHKLLCRHLDLEDVDSIDRFVKDVSQNEPHIDVLINNAAVKDVPNRELTKYGIEKNYFVNFIAPFLLTSKLLPKLIESAAITKNSRVVNVIGCPKRSWEVDTNDINFDQRAYSSKEAYNQSKLALAYITILLDKLNRNQKNCVYVYGTSPCHNKIAKMFEHNANFSEYFKSVVTNYYSHQPIRIVQSTIRCALDSSLTDIGMSGKLYAYFNGKWFWGKASEDENKSKRVWNMATEKLAELQAASSASNVTNNTDVPN